METTQGFVLDLDNFGMGKRGVVEDLKKAWTLREGMGIFVL
jgi:hypothetical protein